MLKTEPYFMTNENWYYFDEKHHKFKLTKEAPREAVQSYKEFYEDEFDFTAQSVLASAINDFRKDMLKQGIPQQDVENILNTWQNQDNTKSLDELINEYLK